MNRNVWKKIQELPLPDGFTWAKGATYWGVKDADHWWHWFCYTDESSVYQEGSIFCHEPIKVEQIKITIMLDPYEAAQFMSAKTCLGMYE